MKIQVTKLLLFHACLSISIILSHAKESPQSTETMGNEESCLANNDNYSAENLDSSGCKAKESPQNSLSSSTIETGKEVPDLLDFESILHWAIQNSDSDALAQSAHEVKNMLSPKDILEKQAYLKDLVEYMNVPSDTDQIIKLISQLKNTSLEETELMETMDQLLDIVETAKNADELYNLGAIDVLINLCYHESWMIRTKTLWVFGQAAQNNPSFQSRIMEMGLLELFFNLTKDSDASVVSKAVYLVSALIRNDVEAQKDFYSFGGEDLIIKLLRMDDDIVFQKKAVTLVGDLASYVSKPETQGAGLPKPLSSPSLLKSLVLLTSSSKDLDLVDRALFALRALLEARGNQVKKILLEECDIDEVLEDCKAFLDTKLVSDEEETEYTQEVIDLWQTVKNLL